jgi:hypothetical protein
MSEKALIPISIAVQIGEPVVAIGAPGVGKTTLINIMGHELGFDGVETIIASLREPSDYAGLPIVTDQGVKLAPPAWARRLAECKRGLAFHDEISTAAPAVQAALLRVIHEGVVGELRLPKTVSHVAAMNPPEQAAGGWELSAPLSNRFCHIYWNAQASEWIQGMISGFNPPRFPRVPESWESGLPEIRTLVASFIQHKPTHLLVVPKNDAEASKPWPSPRSWHMAARLMAAGRAAGYSGKEVVAPLVGGCIGDGLALEFLNWAESLDLPNPEELLKAPEKFKVPDRGDIAYTIMASIATCVCQKMSKPRYLAAWELFGICAKSGKKDYAATAVKVLAQAAVKAGYMSDEKVRTALAANMKPFIELLCAAGLQTS